MKHNKADDVNGWLIIDKPKGMGSTNVVGKTRWLMHANKNGHTGTLDPFATGVLPIAFGEATKLISFITDGDKEYEFVLKFGEQTSTDDTEGEVIATCPKIPTKEEVLAAIEHFIGEITQIPPVYSAIKINGKPAYKRARKGEDVEIPPRKVKIYALDLLEYNSDSVKMRVKCSKGTYVRTLGKDLALFLGTKGHLTELRRTKCGIFSLKDKILLDFLEKIDYTDERRKFLLPIETALRDIAELAVSAEDATKLSMGQSLPTNKYGAKASEAVVAAMSDNCLVALVRIDENKISPIRVFNNLNLKKEI